MRDWSVLVWKSGDDVAVDVAVVVVFCKHSHGLQLSRRCCLGIITIQGRSIIRVLKRLVFCIVSRVIISCTAVVRVLKNNGPKVNNTVIIIISTEIMTDETILTFCWHRLPPKVLARREWPRPWDRARQCRRRCWRTVGSI